MFNLNYFKADSSTFIIKSVNGKVRQQGKGLSFWYNSATTSIAALPLNAQEALLSLTSKLLIFRHYVFKDKFHSKSHHLKKPLKSSTLI